MSTILKKENIFIGCKPAAKEEILEKLGTVLYENGYTTDRYTEALLEKEKVFNTAIGFGMAIPHGIETMKSEILKSGLVVLTTPQGVDWGNGQSVRLIVGIAGLGEEHMELLSQIAMSCCSQEQVDQLVASSKDEIYEQFTK